MHDVYPWITFIQETIFCLAIYKIANSRTSPTSIPFCRLYICYPAGSDKGLLNDIHGNCHQTLMNTLSSTEHSHLAMIRKQNRHRPQPWNSQDSQNNSWRGVCLLLISLFAVYFQSIRVSYKFCDDVEGDSRLYFKVSKPSML